METGFWTSPPDSAFGGPYGFVVLFGNGNGTFQSSVFHQSALEPGWMATGDLSHNGHSDIVLMTPTANSVSIYPNNGKGDFSAPTQTSLIGGRFEIGDINGDGIPDLVSASGYIALGLGNGKFSSPIFYPVEGDSPVNVVLADLRKKGLTDIVGGENLAVSVLLNRGNGTFQDGEWTAVPPFGTRSLRCVPRAP